MNSLLEKYLASSSCVLEVNLDTILVRSVYNKKQFLLTKKRSKLKALMKPLKGKLISFTEELTST